ncbi:MAG: hypothetical protein O7D94_00940, partial [Planctomycetota bacterium]|nr:hypothetical protein [Planctomycetota bacterium]
VGDKAPVYEFLVDDTDPGWTTEAQWAFGPPTGGGSHDGDPSAGFTGANVYGYNLDGDYPSGMPVDRLTSRALPTTNLVGTELRFQRWLGIEAATSDEASIEISGNLGDWTPIWQHTGAAISESAWSQQTIDIASAGDMQTKIYFRWNIGPTDGSTTYPGWNIDDIQVWGIDVTAPLCAGVVFQPADANADGSVNGLDVQMFVDILMDPLAGWTGAQICASELSGDELVDVADVGPFVDSLLGP